MPYDFAGGFNQGQYNPQGYAGRPSGGRFAAYYGRDENGNLRTGPSGQAQAAPAAPAAPNINQGNPQADFFSQLAGLIGNQGQGAPPTTMGAGGGGYTNGPYGPNAYAQEAARVQGLRDASQGMQMVTGGGQGPTGGVSREVQEGGMRGRMMAQGRASGGRINSGQTNPGGMAPPLRPRGPMAMPNKPQGTMGMGEAKPMEGLGRMAPPLQTSPTAMPKPRPLPNMKPAASPMEAGPMRGAKRPRGFSEMGTSRRSASGYGGGL
jgi:hypothetical protein